MQKYVAGILADDDADNISKREAKREAKKGEDKCLEIFFLLYLFSAIVGIVDILLSGSLCELKN
jgi:hypothetical protein